MKHIQILISIIIIFLVGCSNPDIIQLSPDTYVLFREDHRGVFGSPSSLKAGVISDAQKFAEKQGKVAIPLSSRFKPMGIGPAQWAEFEYQFRVVDKDDPEVKRTELNTKVKVIIEKNEKLTSDKKIEDKSKETKDIYSELIKLDDLRERGIITNEEFDARKKKILNEN